MSGQVYQQQQLQNGIQEQYMQQVDVPNNNFACNPNYTQFDTNNEYHNQSYTNQQLFQQQQSYEIRNSSQNINAPQQQVTDDSQQVDQFEYEYGNNTQIQPECWEIAFNQGSNSDYNSTLETNVLDCNNQKDIYTLTRDNSELKTEELQQDLNNNNQQETIPSQYSSSSNEILDTRDEYSASQSNTGPDQVYSMDSLYVNNSCDGTSAIHFNRSVYQQAQDQELKRDTLTRFLEPNHLQYSSTSSLKPSNNGYNIIESHNDTNSFQQQQQTAQTMLRLQILPQTSDQEFRNSQGENSDVISCYQQEDFCHLAQFNQDIDQFTFANGTAVVQKEHTANDDGQSKLKGKRGRPRKRGLRSKSKVNGKLWEFIRDLLLSDRTNPSFIRWERREDGVFKFVQSDKVAKMWGERKQNPKMTYEKLSRAMRYYYKSKVLLPVFGRRLVYKFGPNATGWLPMEV